MPQIPTTPQSQTYMTPAVAGDSLLVPPEEQFWKKYSPHHEFQLSGATSAALHILGIGLIALLGFLVFRTDPKPPDVPQMDAVALDTGDEDVTGSSRGSGGGGGKDGGSSKGKREDVGTTKRQPNDNADPDKADLEDPPDQPVNIDSSDKGARILDQSAATKNLDKLAKNAHKILADRDGVTKGKGGSGKDGGSGGGSGGGKDKGKGKGTGPGPKGETLERRAQRQLRWRVIFNQNSNGDDYKDKLHALGAILVLAEFVPGSQRLRYRKVVRDLSKNPATPNNEDVRRIPGIFWIDDRADSVRSLSEALGISKVPPLIACFFSRDVEDDLRKLERTKYQGKESRIYETQFRIVASAKGRYKGISGQSYKLECMSVRLK